MDTKAIITYVREHKLQDAARDGALALYRQMMKRGVDVTYPEVNRALHAQQPKAVSQPRQLQLV